MGCGVKHARNLWKWIKAYLHSEKLPLHCYETYNPSILDDEEIFSFISQKLQRRGTYMPKILWIMLQHLRFSKSLV
jgi:hypothetical protein